jgi:hypothetical protein
MTKEITMKCWKWRRYMAHASFSTPDSGLMSPS